MNVCIRDYIALTVLSAAYIAACFAGTHFSAFPPGNLAVFWLPPGIAVLMFLFYGKKAVVFIFVSAVFFNGYIFYAQHNGYSHLNLAAVSAVTAVLSTVQAYISAISTRRRDVKKRVFHPNSGLAFYFYSCIIPSVLTVWAIVLLPYAAGFSSPGSETLKSLTIKILFFTVVYSIGIYQLLPVYFLKYSTKFLKSIYSWKLYAILILPIAIILISFYYFEAFLFLLIPLMIITARFSGIFGVMMQSILIFFCLILLVQYKGSYGFLLASGFSYASIVFFIMSISVTAYYIAITGSITEYNAENLEKKVKERTEALQKKNSDLLVLATTDSLTGIANRRHWEQISGLFFVKSKRYSNKISLLMCDVDHFKKINDTYGHHIGDIVLIEISSLLTILLRSSDLIGRYGGEEFIILLPEEEIDHAMKVAEKIRHCIENFFLTDNDLPQCTISIGVSSVEPEDRSIDDCILRADKALYKAKKSGRNKVILYTPETCDNFTSPTE